MKTIKLNSTIGIDLDKLIESRLLIQANSGGGKSWAIRRIIEQTFGHVQIIVIDPEGEFGNMRSEFDFVYVGKGGDAPAESRSAALLSHRLLELKASAIIDLYELPPQERKHFVRLFLEAMVNAPKELWHDCLIVLDEAHIFAPEKSDSEALGAVIDLATRGRKRGFSVVLASQRISKLHKDAAAECNNKLIGRTTLDIDRKRAGEELGLTSKEEILALRNLMPGEFMVFGPAIGRDVERVAIGDVKVKPEKRGVNRGGISAPSATVKKILAKLADLPQEAAQEAKTIAEFKAENAGLKKKLAHNPQNFVENASKTQKEIERAVKVSLEKRDKEWRILIQKWKKYAKLMRNRIISLSFGLEEFDGMSDDLENTPSVELTGPPSRVYVPPVENNFGVGASAPDSAEFNSNEFHGEKPLSKGALLILMYLKSRYPHWKSKVQIGTAVGYAPGGNFNNLIYELTGVGLIEKDGKGRYAALEGIDQDFDQGFDVDLNKWQNKLSAGAWKIFKLMIDHEHESFWKETIAQETGYSVGGNFNNLIYELTGKELIVKVGTLYQINPDILDL